jgi:hypothetical protein
VQVSQDPVLFTGTIADNISYGKYGKATPQEVSGFLHLQQALDLLCIGAGVRSDLQLVSVLPSCGCVSGSYLGTAAVLTVLKAQAST